MKRVSPGVYRDDSGSLVRRQGPKQAFKNTLPPMPINNRMGQYTPAQLAQVAQPSGDSLYQMANELASSDPNQATRPSPFGQAQGFGAGIRGGAPVRNLPLRVPMQAMEGMGAMGGGQGGPMMPPPSMNPMAKRGGF